MNTVLPRRPILALPFLLPPHPSTIHHIPSRHQSTSRRTTKRLRAKPAKEVLLPSAATLLQARDHIVFNPPSAAPSPFHTPFIFLPPTDPRRQLLNPTAGPEYPSTRSSSDAGASAGAGAAVNADRPLPPPVREPYQKKYHLDEAQVTEIRRLRTTDPYTWTRAKLAEKFGCTQFFVGMVVQAPPDRMAQSRRMLETIKERWGPRRTHAREDRAKRREIWARDG